MRLHTFAPYWSTRSVPVVEAAPQPPVRIFANTTDTGDFSRDSLNAITTIDPFQYQRLDMISLDVPEGMEDNKAYLRGQGGFVYDPRTSCIFSPGTYSNGTGATSYDLANYQVSRIDPYVPSVTWHVSPLVGVTAATHDQPLIWYVMGVTDNVVWVVSRGQLGLSVNVVVLGLDKATGATLYTFSINNLFGSTSPSGTMSGGNHGPFFHGLSDTSFVIGHYTTTGVPGTQGLNIVTMTGPTTFTAQDVYMPNDSLTTFYPRTGWTDVDGNFYVSYQTYILGDVPIVYKLNPTTFELVPIVTINNVGPYTQVRNVQIDETGSFAYVTIYRTTAIAGDVVECIRLQIESPYVWTEVGRWGGYNSSIGYNLLHDNIEYCNGYLFGYWRYGNITTWDVSLPPETEPSFTTDTWDDFWYGYMTPYRRYASDLDGQDAFAYPGNSKNFVFAPPPPVGVTPRPYLTEPPEISRFIYDGDNTDLRLTGRVTWFAYEYTGTVSVRLTGKSGLDLRGFKGHLFDSDGRLINGYHYQGNSQGIDQRLHFNNNLPGIYYLAIVNVTDNPLLATSIDWRSDSMAAGTGWHVETYDLPEIDPTTINMTVYTWFTNPF